LTWFGESTPGSFVQLDGVLLDAARRVEPSAEDADGREVANDGRAGELTVRRQPLDVRAEVPWCDLVWVVYAGVGQVCDEFGDVPAVGDEAVWAQATLDGDEEHEASHGAGEHGWCVFGVLGVRVHGPFCRRSDAAWGWSLGSKMKDTRLG